jgi:hypothetical protein
MFARPTAAGAAAWTGGFNGTLRGLEDLTDAEASTSTCCRGSREPTREYRWDGVDEWPDARCGMEPEISMLVAKLRAYLSAVDPSRP